MRLLYFMSPEKLMTLNFDLDRDDCQVELTGDVLR